MNTAYKHPSVSLNKVGYETRLFLGGPGWRDARHDDAAIQASPKRLQCCVAGGPFGSGNVLRGFVPEVSPMSWWFLIGISKLPGGKPLFQGRKWLVSGRVRERCKITPEASMYIGIPSREITYPPDKAYLKIIFLFPRWDMLVAWRVFTKPFPLVHVYRSFTYIMWVKNPYIRRIWDGFFMLDLCAVGIAYVVDMIRIPAQLSWR